MRAIAIFAGLLTLAAAPVLAVQTNPSAVIEPPTIKPALVAWGSDNERLDRLKKELGFTGEVVAWRDSLRP